MAVPTITPTQVIFEGETVTCARIYVPDEDSDFKFTNAAPVDDSYIFQMVAKADSNKTLTITVGESVRTQLITSGFIRYIMRFPEVQTDAVKDMYITFPPGTYYLFNLQLERATTPSGWRPAPEDSEDVEEIATDIATDIVNAQTQRDIFNKLTNNGQAKGMILTGNELYLNATYINTGTLDANLISAGSITASKLSNQVNSAISTAQTTANTAQSTANSANLQEQTIYRSKASGTTSIPGNTSWVADVSGAQDTWTLKRPVYHPSYPVLFVAVQRKTVGGAITCTAPQVDQTTTVIDGGHITTGSIDAGRITAGYMNGERITAGTISAAKLSSAVITSISNAQTAADDAQTTADRAEGKADTATTKANSANSQEQLIYRSAASGTSTMPATTTWVTDATGGQNKWTLVRPVYSTSYPVLFVATQRKNVAGTVTCTTPAKDETTTVIDGGHITTGTIDASAVNVININAGNITTGTISANKVKAGTLADNAGKFSFNLTTGAITAKDATLEDATLTGEITTSGEDDNNKAIESKLDAGRLIFYNDNQGIGRMAAISDGEYKDFSIQGYGHARALQLINGQWYGVYVYSSVGAATKQWGYTQRIQVNGTLACLNNTRVVGSLTVDGTKSRIADAGQYSDRLLYAYETPSPMFGDVGEGVIGEDGLCYIFLDPIFANTIKSNQYQVFLQRYGAGDAYISKRHPGYFVVQGEPGLSFGWELKAKQSGYDQLRLERADDYEKPVATYGEDAAEHIRDLQNGRITA